MPEIVPATAEMIARFEGHTKTVRAIAAVDGDRVLGVTGFYPQNGHYVLFAGIAEDARREMNRHKRTLIACARKVMAMTRGMPLLAHADPDIEGSDVLLKHLGFTPTNDKDIWQWLGQR